MVYSALGRADPLDINAGGALEHLHNRTVPYPHRQHNLPAGISHALAPYLSPREPAHFARCHQEA